MAARLIMFNKPCDISSIPIPMKCPCYRLDKKTFDAGMRQGIEGYLLFDKKPFSIKGLTDKAVLSGELAVP